MAMTMTKALIGTGVMTVIMIVMMIMRIKICSRLKIQKR